MTHLDITRIRHLRHERALSSRSVEDALGVGGGWLHNLENDRNTAHVTIAQVHQLAAILGVTATDLLPHDAPDDGHGDTHAELDADTRRLAQVLLEHGRRVRVSDLADALDWTLERTGTALDHAAARLPLVGMRLSTAATGVAVVRDTADRDGAVDALARGVTLTTGELRLLHALWRRPAHKLTKTEREVAAPKLVRAGLLEPPSGARHTWHRLTDRAVTSLMTGHGL